MGFIKSSCLSYVAVIITYLIYGMTMGIREVFVFAILISVYLVPIGLIGFVIGEIIFRVFKPNRWVGGPLYVVLGGGYAFCISLYIYSNYYDTMVYLLTLSGALSFYLCKSNVIGLRSRRSRNM